MLNYFHSFVANNGTSEKVKKIVTLNEVEVPSEDVVDMSLLAVYLVGGKVAYAVSQGLKVIASVRKTLEQQEYGSMVAVVTAQTKAIEDALNVINMIYGREITLSEIGFILQDIFRIPFLWCRFDVELRDTSGSIFATIFGQNAETFLSCSAKQLMEQTNEI
ncbi:hypothetical protein Dsin_019660 [Dipteronia sinensis]|uniref:Uncharacterized protein n=1 Tax=Dipteronia sinensis TaxID=43782 RepID=A0AAE0A8D6_9ROSI|nr:hypothetical protein Dsin_019660 [Dipteronia sinensis]